MRPLHRNSIHKNDEPFWCSFIDRVNFDFFVIERGDGATTDVRCQIKTISNKKAINWGVNPIAYRAVIETAY